jgi:protein-tyrosine phosphatase
MFVCLGNICRSPAAEGILKAMIQQRGLEGKLAVDSAGTASYHIGKLPDSRMIEAAARRGYLLATKAKAFTKAMISERDIVIAMDRENYSEILLIAGGQQGNVKLLSDFLDASWPRDVPDPYHGGEAGFEYVLDMLEAAGPKLLGEPKILGE